MKTPPSSGKCNLCGGSFPRAAMTRHLQGCQRPKSAASSSASAKGPASAKGKVQSFHLVVEGRGSKVYWLHVAAPADAPLRKLDDFLRRIWLECCGHMSAFSIGGQRYAIAPMADYGEKNLRVPLSQVLQFGDRFSYEYDFGSTTELTLKVAGVLEGVTPKGVLRLLARNDPPLFPCDVCGTGKVATQICTECAWSGGGWLCKECAAAHKCDPEMFLPVVNSPRAGVCAYTG